MAINIFSLDNVKASLERFYKNWKINENELMAYFFFFDSIRDQEELIKTAIINLNKDKGVFEDIINSFEESNKTTEDGKKIEELKNVIK